MAQKTLMPFKVLINLQHICNEIFRADLRILASAAEGRMRNVIAMQTIIDPKNGEDFQYS